MRRRSNSRCKGFLEIQGIQHPASAQEEDPDWELCTVQYLHRTVKDYIESPDVQSKLESSLRSPYDPDFGHCAGLLAMIRTRKVQLHPFNKDGTTWKHIDQFLYHASRVTQIHYPPLLDLMDELDNTCSSIAKKDAQRASQMEPSEWQWSENEKKLLVIGQWAAFHPYREIAPISGGIISHLWFVMVYCRMYNARSTSNASSNHYPHIELLLLALFIHSCLTP